MRQSDLAFQTPDPIADGGGRRPGRPSHAGTLAMSHANRDLLFGLIALQNGMIDQSQLVAAFQAWTLEKDRPLAEHLVGRGDLEARSAGDHRGDGRPAPQEARRQRGEEPGRDPGGGLDPADPGADRRPRPGHQPGPAPARE